MGQRKGVQFVEAKKRLKKVKIILANKIFFVFLL